jgi:mRNA-degrading endonuclease RelE of RelBE toxin-antitoxin system
MISTGRYKWPWFCDRSKARSSRGGAGLRKLRWGGKGHGKSGGFRFIYYWDKKTETIYMLYVYPKNRQEDLTTEQRKLLSRVVREEYK